MNCKRCKYKVNPNASFCHKCGEPIEFSNSGNFLKDNILKIFIAILVVVVIGLVISIINIKKDTGNTPVLGIETPKEEEKLEEEQEPEVKEETEKHPLDDTAIATMEEMIVNFIQDYAHAVNIGDPNYLDKYLVYNGEDYKSYQKLIPNYYSKGIVLDAVSIEITNIERYDEDTFRASLVTEYEISNSSELRYQKESIDYLINSKGNGIYLIDKSENYKLLDKYTIESYG